VFASIEVAKYWLEEDDLEGVASNIRFLSKTASAARCMLLMTVLAFFWNVFGRL
jgi:hypothetical protein